MVSARPNADIISKAPGGGQHILKDLGHSGKAFFDTDRLRGAVPSIHQSRREINTRNGR